MDVVGVVRRGLGSLQIEVTGTGTARIMLILEDPRQLVAFIRAIASWQRRTLRNLTEGLDPGSSGIPIESVPEAREPARRDVVGRISEVEKNLDKIVNLDTELVELLAQGKGVKKREARIPSPGTMYHKVLLELVDRFGGSKFESSQVADEKRHVLSILSNKYGALEVAETRGRTNVYRIRRETMESILHREGRCSIVEIAGKDRQSCDAFLDSMQEPYPGFTYSFLEKRGTRQRYRLLFWDRSTQLALTAKLGRFVGDKSNLILREAKDPDARSYPSPHASITTSRSTLGESKMKPTKRDGPELS